MHANLIMTTNVSSHHRWIEYNEEQSFLAKLNSRHANHFSHHYAINPCTHPDKVPWWYYHHPTHAFHHCHMCVLRGYTLLKCFFNWDYNGASLSYLCIRDANRISYCDMEHCSSPNSHQTIFCCCYYYRCFKTSYASLCVCCVRFFCNSMCSAFKCLIVFTF